MRLPVFASVLSVLALGAIVTSPGPATAAKSKMGCEIGSEVWNATAGKCEPGTPKHKAAEKKSTADSTPPPPAKKAAKKKTPSK
jgi:hypothetical protein